MKMPVIGISRNIADQKERYFGQLVFGTLHFTWGIGPASYRRTQRQRSNDNVTVRTS